MKFTDFTVKDNQGNDTPLKKYEGKVLLVINTATQCGLTPQYEAIEALYEQYRDKGFEVLDFPCNQFMNQAPGSDAEIDSFCTLNYNTKFDRFAKVDVNGPEADPLFVFLKEQAPEDTVDDAGKKFEKKIKLIKRPKEASDIKWNFGKFLIDREGNVVGRYGPGVEPQNMKEAIEKLL